MDVYKIRKDYPELSIKENGKPIIYFDNAATSLRPVSVIDTVKKFYTSQNANIHRGVHKLSIEATKLYEAAHKKVSSFINAKGIKEIVFTRNTTESINLVVHSLLSSNYFKKGDRIVISLMEHHSNMVPFQYVRDKIGVELKCIPIDSSGNLIMEEAEKLINGGNTKFVSITQASNVLGTVNDVKTIGKLAHAKGALFCVDGAQSVPHIKVDVQDINCDFLAFSGHKMLGPTGIGVLYAKEDILNNMEPFIRGGDMISIVTTEKATWNELPWKFEAGTSNIAGGIGLGAAVDYLSAIGMEQIEKHEEELVGYALEQLSRLKFVKIYGPPKRIGVIAFNISTGKGFMRSDIMGSILDKEGIVVRTGCHCAQPLHQFYDVSGTVRASFYLYNTLEEIDKFLSVIRKFGGL